MAKFCIFQHFNNIVLYQMIARVWTSKTISMFDTAIINSFKFRINHIFHSYCEQNEIIMNIIKLWLTQDWPTGPSSFVLRWNLLEKSGITRFYEVILRYINFDKNDPGHHDGQCKLTCNTNIFMFPMFKKFKSSKYYFALDWEEVYHTQHWEKGETLQSNMYNLHNIIKVSIYLFVPYFEI